MRNCTFHQICGSYFSAKKNAMLYFFGLKNAKLYFLGVMPNAFFGVLPARNTFCFYSNHRKNTTLHLKKAKKEMHFTFLSPKKIHFAFFSSIDSGKKWGKK